MTFDAEQRTVLREKFVAFADNRSDEKLRNELIEAHLGLAEYLARRFNNRGEPVDGDDHAGLLERLTDGADRGLLARVEDAGDRRPLAVVGTCASKSAHCQRTSGER